jgi:hypothetical protein
VVCEACASRIVAATAITSFRLGGPIPPSRSTLGSRGAVGKQRFEAGSQRTVVGRARAGRVPDGLAGWRVGAANSPGAGAWRLLVPCPWLRRCASRRLCLGRRGAAAP